MSKCAWVLLSFWCRSRCAPERGDQGGLTSFIKRIHQSDVSRLQEAAQLCVSCTATGRGGALTDIIRPEVGGFLLIGVTGGCAVGIAIVFHSLVFQVILWRAHLQQTQRSVSEILLAGTRSAKVCTSWCPTLVWRVPICSRQGTCCEMLAACTTWFALMPVSRDHSQAQVCHQRLCKQVHIDTCHAHP